MSKISTDLSEKLDNAVWVAKALFDRGKVTGSTSNLSFRHEDTIYISGSGKCFGNLQPVDFSAVSLDGKHLSGCKPSKEFPLHAMLYKKSEKVQAVIHTHSFYSTLWSCIDHDKPQDCIPDFTPYLKMKLGTVGIVPYAAPGSQQLFGLFEKYAHKSDGYLLKNHGPVVGGEDVMSAFYNLEELEESAKIAWYLRSENVTALQNE